MNPNDKYSLQDWAQLFLLATVAAETGNNTPIENWVSQHSDDHGLPQPSGNDIKHLIEEALQFLEKFSENHIDNMYNR
jgi:hypothetical protein